MTTANEPRTPQEIASAALALWDANAEKCDSGRALGMAVATGLIDQGVNKELAAVAAALANRAFDAAAFPAKSIVPEPIRNHPIFRAMLAELQEGKWDLSAIRGE